MDGLKRALKRLGDGNATNGVVTITITLLEGAEKAASLTSVPGVGELLALLREILSKAQATTDNRKALHVVCEEITSLYSHISDAMEMVDSAFRRYGDSNSSVRKRMHSGLAESPLVVRIGSLKEELRKIREDTENLSRNPWYIKWAFSKQDANAISNIKDGLAKARQHFQFQGTISIEALVKGVLDRLMAEADEEVLKQLAPRFDASYRAAINEMKSRFLEDTRNELFEDLHSWIDDTTGETHQWQNKQVVFLRGEAGIGKSTVATELCRRLARNNGLGASFFFTRGVRKLDSTELFFPTIAVQLATLQPSLRPHIVDAARKYLQSGPVQQMRYAYEELFQKPLLELPEDHHPFVIVVDALDECVHQAAELVPIFLRYLLTGATQFSKAVHILILSRPEMYYVREVLDAPEFRKAVYTVSLSNPRYVETVHRDISVLIENKINAYVWSRKWLSTRPQVVSQLTGRSNGVFIYAETAANFLLSDPNNLDERLYLILSTETPIGFSNLDMLYLRVLETAFPKQDRYPLEEERMHRVLGYIACLREEGQGFTPRMLQYLTGMSVEGSMSILNKLRSVVHFEFNNPDSRFRVVHLTFREFLPSRRCPSSFRVTAAVAQSQLAVHCMMVLILSVRLPSWCTPPSSSCRKWCPPSHLDICRESSKTALGCYRPLPFHVWYALEHIEEHLALAGTMERRDPVERDIVHTFKSTGGIPFYCKLPHG